MGARLVQLSSFVYPISFFPLGAFFSMVEYNMKQEANYDDRTITKY